MSKSLLVIDLDQTIIDSSIRENFCYPDGSLCLETYRTNKQCAVNGIVNDTLTPFGEWLKANFYNMTSKFDIIFLTVRLCDKQDYTSFKKLGIDSMLLDHCLLIERGICALYGGDSSEQDSGLYKKAVIQCLQSVYNYNNNEVIVVDDCIKVLNMAKQQGFKTICARELYHYDNRDFDALF